MRPVLQMGSSSYFRFVIIKINMDKKVLAKYLDLANHHQQVTEEDIKNLCQKVLEYGFHSGFINPYYVSLAKSLIGDQAAVGTVVSFPLGQETLQTKVFSSCQSVKNGADELDVSMNVGLLKQGKYQEVLNEFKTIIDEVRKVEKKHTVIKFIIETGHLTEKEIEKASLLIFESGADFIKTCSGMGPRGASFEDVKIIKRVVGEKIKIKVAGGIGSYSQTLKFINLGVSRLGSSKAVEILKEMELEIGGE